MGCHEHVMYCNESIVMDSEESPRIHMTKKHANSSATIHSKARIQHTAGQKQASLRRLSKKSRKMDTTEVKTKKQNFFIIIIYFFFTSGKDEKQSATSKQNKSLSMLLFGMGFLALRNLFFMVIALRNQFFSMGRGEMVSSRTQDTGVPEQRNYYVIVALSDHLQKILILGLKQTFIQEVQVETKSLHSKERKQPTS